MAFQLKSNEPVGAGITRNVRRQLEKALKYLASKPNQHERVSENEAVFEVRKCFKRIRAALRLVREELGDDLYHEENWCFRDAARPLTEIRDAHVLVEAAARLSQQLPATIEPAVFAKIHDALVKNQREVTHRVLERDKAFLTVSGVATRALARLPDWRLQRDSWPALMTGLRHVYRTGRRALAMVVENPTVENLHELRKQAKYLWHQLQLIEAALTGVEKKLADETHELSTLLGEDHDLAMLRQTLAADPLAFGGHLILKGVFVIIDGRRRELQGKALALARQIYQDPARVFAGRIEASMSYQEVK